MNMLTYNVHRVLNRYLMDSLRDRRDMLAIQVLAPLSSNYLPWSQAAMRPSAIVAVLNDIIINNRTHVVECGGGISTFYIARLLRERGGHIHTIEHDAGWAGILQQALEAEGLGDYATVIFAPLARSSHSLDGNQWYAEDKLRCLVESRGIDLLVVDGPPAYGQELRYARYPAVPFFKSALADDYTVVLDDINRQGEQEILQRWEQKLGITFDRRFVDGTIGVGRPRRSFTI
jgi:hypothetical protein